MIDNLSNDEENSMNDEYTSSQKTNLINDKNYKEENIVVNS